MVSMVNQIAANPLSRELGERVVDVLDRVVLAPLKPDLSIDKADFFSGGRRHLEDCDFYFVSELTDRLEGGGRYYFHPLEAPRDLIEMFWPVDCAMLVEKGIDSFVATRLATVAPKEIRGLVKLVPAKCALLTSGTVLQTDQPWRADVWIVGFLNGRWQEISTQKITSRTDGIRGNTKIVMSESWTSETTTLNRHVGIILSAQLTQRYDWHVAFGKTEQGTRLVLPTNPRGCLELFRTRELAPGEKRRAALRHWVNEHYRERSKDATQLDYVCEHLRGNTRFSWNGLACELMVSAFDLEKNEFFRKRAAEWRAMRRHNRIVVRLKSRK